MKMIKSRGLLGLLLGLAGADCFAADLMNASLVKQEPILLAARGRHSGGGGGGRSHSSGGSFSHRSGSSGSSFSSHGSGGRRSFRTSSAGSSRVRSTSLAGSGASSSRVSRTSRARSSGLSSSRSSRRAARLSSAGARSRSGWRRSYGSGYRRRSVLFSNYRSCYWNRPLGFWSWGLIWPGWSYFDPLYGFYYPGYGYYYCGGVGFFVPHSRFGYRYGWWTYPFTDITYTIYVADQSDREIILSNGTQSDLYFAFYYQDGDGTYIRAGVPRLLERIDTGQCYVPRSRRGMSRSIVISHNDADLAQEIAAGVAQRLAVRNLDMGSGRMTLKAIEDSSEKLTRLIDLTQEELDRIKEIEKRIEEDNAFRKQAAEQYEQREQAGEVSDSEPRGRSRQDDESDAARPEEKRRRIERDFRDDAREEERMSVEQDNDSSW
ncbi:hypothetical protein K2X40_01110 [Candidatus Babeliales bacterium]|nr:hypothetical protein [Candidatus Babeliales bacterium]